MLEEQRLDSRVHNCAAFDCGTPELNDYLTRRATQDRQRNLTQVYVLVDTEQISDRERRRLPRYPVPCFRMGRFAVQQDIQGQGLGKQLLGCAVDRCLRVRQEVAAYALVVDAIDDKAKSFYEYFGFMAFADRPLSLYLVIRS